jgi:phospholipid/cholesterol/gamma-HCH transport system ATP-binding protein
LKLVVNQLSKSFPPRQILSRVSFELEQGSLTGLIGPSGCGKSILLKIIGQIVRSDSGFIEYAGAREFPVSLMFQEGALFDSLTVLDNVAFPLVQGHVPHTLLPKAQRAEVRERCLEVLGRVGLKQAAEKLPGELSGGMRRRASLARALVCKPPFMLLDDPTGGLDPVASSVIMNLIAEVHREYKPTILIVSHDLRRLFPLVERIHALFSGEIVFSGTVSELASDGSSMLKRFVSARYDLDGQGCSAILENQQPRE